MSWSTTLLRVCTQQAVEGNNCDQCGQECMSCSSSSDTNIWCDEQVDGLVSGPSSSEDLGDCIDTVKYNVDEIAAQQDDCCRPYLSTTQASTGLTATHRATVVDDMTAAAARLGLGNDTLFTAVACLDRYLAVKPTPLKLLQPTGIACLWVAAKYEQLIAMPAGWFALQMVGPAGDCLGSGPPALQLLVNLEQTVLKALDYRLASFVTTNSCKDEIMTRLWSSGTAAALTQQQCALLYNTSSYLTEVSLLEYQLLAMPPSQLAAAAFALAHVLVGTPLSDAQLLQHTGYSLAQLAIPFGYICATHTTLSGAMQSGRPYAVSQKYSEPSLLSVAALPPLVENDPRMLGGRQQQQGAVQKGTGGSDDCCCEECCRQRGGSSCCYEKEAQEATAAPAVQVMDVLC